MLNVIMERHYDECHYAERVYAESPNAEGHYAECHYAEWRYAECCGTKVTYEEGFSLKNLKTFSL